jgi:ribosomal protein L11 methyltransferase
MGFGTGHHQSTRLCLKLLQRHRPAGAAVLDIGTGSGVLAIAAWKLGATSALGIDFDRDALASATENIEMNDAGHGVTLDAVDITRGTDALARRFDLVFANITGTMLQRHAAAVASTLAAGGVLITSGFQTHELDDVTAAFVTTGLARIDDVEEGTWVSAAFR